MFEAIARIDKLLGKYLDHVFAIAANQAAAKLQIKDFGVIVLEHHVFDVHAFEFLLMLGPLLDVPVQLAILGNRVAPKLTATTWLLTNLKFDTFFLLILRQLHLAGSLG